MRRLLLPSLLCLFVFSFSIQAQNSRVSDLAKQLQRNVTDLADRMATEFFGRSNNNRDQVNNLLTLQQVNLTTEIFLLLVQKNRPNAELRDTADSLNERLSRINSEPSNRLQLQQLKKDIDDLISELKKTGSSSEKKPENTKTLGNLYWQGTIDDEVHLIIRGNTVQAKTISGTQYNDVIFNFSSPLPEENVQVSINKKDGRGTAKVIQQPTADNDFTAIIQILDKNGGAREYELEIYWTK
jgi:anion-transporting  ArsA/GET3 family ATPase